MITDLAFNINTLKYIYKLNTILYFYVLLYDLLLIFYHTMEIIQCVIS